ncbi:GNAT family N-acetyltransferase [Aestuariibius sp. 2305UL40-4]|uniref:GNAT family N-acetyltransferase n=1 Tax=Aestuariibius violaceus TaxID=3234132 RepID=UPI00345E1B5F
MPPFDPPPTLDGPTFRLAPLRAGDIPALTEAVSDPVTWAGHPATDRYKPEIFTPYAEKLLAAGGTLTLTDRAQDRITGCSRYYPVPGEEDGIGIGFTFLHHSYWGTGANREVKRLMLDHAFAHVPEVWFHIAPTNIRSQKATAKLGARFVREEPLGFLGAPPVATFSYRLTRATWTRQTSS